MDEDKKNQMTNNPQFQEALEDTQKTVQGEKEDEQKHASEYNYLCALDNSASVLIVNESAARQSTSDFTPDEWVIYITPLVNRALTESKEGINPEHLYQEFILAGVLIGLGKKPQEAIEQVEEWEKTGLLSYQPFQTIVFSTMVTQPMS